LLKYNTFKQGNTATRGVCVVVAPDILKLSKTKLGSYLKKYGKIKVILYIKFQKD
jgi:hypothetical protein